MLQDGCELVTRKNRQLKKEITELEETIDYLQSKRNQARIDDFNKQRQKDIEDHRFMMSHPGRKNSYKAEMDCEQVIESKWVSWLELHIIIFPPCRRQPHIIISLQTSTRSICLCSECHEVLQAIVSH